MPVKGVYLFVNIQKARVPIPKAACPLIKYQHGFPDKQLCAQQSHTAYRVHTLTVFCLRSCRSDTQNISLSYVYKDTVFFQD